MLLSLYCLFVAITYQAEGRVDNDFTKCPQVFYMGKEPDGFKSLAKSHRFKEIPDGITVISDLASPAYICQTFGGNSYYATLYDRGRLIPLYSGYILDRKSTSTKPGCSRAKTFKLEPQLVYREVTENMELTKDIRQTIIKYNKEKKISEREEKNRINHLIETSQAMEYDYTDKNSNKYTRGHLNPCGHHIDQNNYLSTFTLTNIVPMATELNNDVWGPYEEEMVTIAAGCSKMYVVTGSVPGNNELNKRVTIPTYVWNAYCCVDNIGTPIKSGGAIAANDKGLITTNKFEVTKMELGDLQEKLKKHLGVSHEIEIFNCDCKKQENNRRCSV